MPIIEGHNGETCTDHGNPVVRVLNDVTVYGGNCSTGDAANSVTLDGDVAQSLAMMPHKERVTALVGVIHDAAEKRGRTLPGEQVAKKAEEVADFLDNEALAKRFGKDWPQRLRIIITIEFKWWIFKVKITIEIPFF